MGEFGCGAKAAVCAVGVLEEVVGGAVADIGRGFGLVVVEVGDEVGAEVEVSSELVGLCFDLWSFLSPGGVDAAEDVGPAGHAGASLRREVGASEEGFAVGSAEDVERPAAVAVEHLLCVHVDFVDVGAFFAVDFDGDDEFVLELCDVVVFEGFAFHDVAPVAGGVADADEDGFVLFAGELPGFVAPGVPVDGVVLVLE